MIVREKPNAFKLFFILRGSIVPRILPQIIFIALLASIVASVQFFYPGTFRAYTTAPFTLLGVALSLFLGFRNNACYDRWWEARRQWGQLVVDARSLARQATSLIDNQIEGGSEAQKRLVHLTIAFSHALRHHLRQTDPWGDMKKYVAPSDLELLRQSQNLPDCLLRLMGHELGDCRKNKLLSDILVQSIDERITSLAGILAACERIHNAPLPFAYMLLVHRTAYLYCFMLPFGLVASLGMATPFFCALIAYAFFGLDVLSEELEEPFGLANNALPLKAMSRTIEINLLEVLGEEDLPLPLQPDAYFLQ